MSPGNRFIAGTAYERSTLASVMRCVFCSDSACQRLSGRHRPGSPVGLGKQAEWRAMLFRRAVAPTTSQIP